VTTGTATATAVDKVVKDCVATTVQRAEFPPSQTGGSFRYTFVL
jgi:hypothetical protein